MSGVTGVITEKSSVALSLVIAAWAGLVAAGIWIGAIGSRSEGHEKAIAEIKGEQRETVRIFQSIDRRLSNIEGRMGIREGK